LLAAADAGIGILLEPTFVVRDALKRSTLVSPLDPYAWGTYRPTLSFLQAGVCPTARGG